MPCCLKVEVHPLRLQRRIVQAVDDDLDVDALRFFCLSTSATRSPDSSPVKDQRLDPDRALCAREQRHAYGERVLASGGEHRDRALDGCARREQARRADFCQVATQPLVRGAEHRRALDEGDHLFRGSLALLRRAARGGEHQDEQPHVAMRTHESGNVRDGRARGRAFDDRIEARVASGSVRDHLIRACMRSGDRQVEEAVRCTWIDDEAGGSNT